MSDSAESLTISSKTCSHLNLVKLQKNKTDNTITLDIISTNCKVAPHNKSRNCRSKSDDLEETPLKTIFKFSFQHQLSSSTPHLTADVFNIAAINGVRTFSLFWIMLVNVTTTLSFAASK